jgi:hypothetical protein
MAQVQFKWVKSSTGRAGQDFLQISGAYKKADEYPINAYCFSRYSGTHFGICTGRRF